MIKLFTAAARAIAYTCRGCGTDVSYPERFRKCPVCGIKW